MSLARPYVGFTGRDTPVGPGSLHTAQSDQIGTDRVVAMIKPAPVQSGGSARGY
jgi:hypothetical protein